MNKNNKKMSRAGRPPKFNEERAQIIIDARRNGKTYAEAGILAGVPDTTIMRWKNQFCEFNERVKKAEQEHEQNYKSECLVACKRSLMELITGFDVQETKTEYENDSYGNPRIKKQTNATKHFAPNATAIIFALTNLCPETWKNRQTTDVNATTKNETDVSLDKVPDDLLAKVIDAINAK